jgi:molybdopterin-containing oxidoreductase family iron-sulfur binding subunit
MKTPAEPEPSLNTEPARARTPASGIARGELLPLAGRGNATDGLPIIEDGPFVWNSLEAFWGSAAAADVHQDEAAIQQHDWPSRRDFLRFMAASLALGTTSGCAFQPAESIVPYVQAPESLVPGKPQFYASAIAVDGYACGVIVKSDMGRPIKIEGNPEHPASQGAADAVIQASLLTLYDPDRSKLVIHNGRADTWEHFQTLALDVRAELLARKGAGLRVLTGTVTSPTLAGQLERLREQFPQARWHSYDPLARDAIRAGWTLAFGEDVEPIYHFDRADVVVALDADFLGSGPARLAHARAFAARREPSTEPASAAMNRLYVVECTPTLTGATADHRLAISAQDVALFAKRLGRDLGLETRSAVGAPASPGQPTRDDRFRAALVSDLQSARGRSLVVAGDTQPPQVHALCALINHALGNIGKTIDLIRCVSAGPHEQFGSLRDLVTDIRSGVVDTLLILGGNPAYDAPRDLDFAAVLASDKVRLRVHHGLYHDETAELCHWHLPEAHWLESWSDARAFDGTASIVQPLIAPLYGGRSAHELLSVFLGEPGGSGLDIVREHWRRAGLSGDFESIWRKALAVGVIPGATEKPRVIAPRIQDFASVELREGKADGLEIVFRPDPTLGDGRHANNAWLQELPKPLTRLTWDHAALVSPALAKRMGIDSNDVIEIRYRGRAIRVPAWIMPGQAVDSVTVFFGQGRTRAGRVGNGVGVDVYPLRTSERPWFDSGLEIFRTAEQRRLAATQHHFQMEGRDVIRVAALDEYRRNPEFARKHEQDSGKGPSLIDEPRAQVEREIGQGNAWGMVINLNTCIGCGACVLACQAENNIPVVGREQVLASREMHWIRVDRYFEGHDANEPGFDFQPVPCMHCEKAPCELVCPVGATTHSAEGLNEMTYNRCIGTRYCSNNCPYKVRRFNFLQYSDETTPALKLLHNPDVTIRPRGVMEKCTYCVQRITAGRIAAEIENRAVKDGEIVTACQAACPTRAIVFGNLNDEQSAVRQLKANPRNYGLLAELNTQPRTTYLAKLRNPNPALESGERDDRDHS